MIGSNRSRNNVNILTLTSFLFVSIKPFKPSDQLTKIDMSIMLEKTKRQ